MEGAHGQLRSRLADGLGGNDADGLPHVDQGATGQIPAVAEGARAAAGLAGEHGTDFHGLDIGLLDDDDQFLLDQLPALHQHLAGDGMDDI